MPSKTTAKIQPGALTSPLFQQTTSEHVPLLLPMRAEVMYFANPNSWNVTRSGEGVGTRFQWFPKQWEGPQDDPSEAAARFVQEEMDLQRIDSEKLLAEFYAIDTIEKAQHFLERSGPFRADAIEVTWPNLLRWRDYFARQSSLEKGWGPPPEVNDQQKALPRVMGHPSMHVASVTRPSRTGGVGRETALQIVCDSTVEALAAQVYLGKVKDGTKRTCLACGTPFPAQRSTARYCDVHKKSKKKGAIPVLEPAVSRAS